MKAKGVKPLKLTQRQIGSVKQKQMAAFIPLIHELKKNLRDKGHGGDWGANRYRGEGPTIFASMKREKDYQIFTKIGHKEAMDSAIEGKGIYILPFTTEVVLENPVEDDFEDARKTTDAVERFEYQQLTSSLYPDLSKIDQARRMQESGTFRTMAEITSGTKAPSVRPIKVRGMTDKRMRAQVLGLQPTPLETLSANESRRLRNRIRDYIYRRYEKVATEKLGKKKVTEKEFLTQLEKLGADEVALMDALLEGHERYIDSTPSTINDFSRLIMAYHKMRSKNTPYLREIVPSLMEAISQTPGLFKGFEQKFLDAISPTAQNLLNAQTIHLIYDLEGDVLVPSTGLKLWQYIAYGEVEPEAFVDPAFVSDETKKSVNRLMASHMYDGTSAAKAVIQASKEAFLSKKGVADIGLNIVAENNLDANDVPKAVAEGLDEANEARNKHELFADLFSIRNKEGKQSGPETRRRIMGELTRRGLAFTISAPGYKSNPAEGTTKEGGAYYAAEEAEAIFSDLENQKQADMKRFEENIEKQYSDEAKERVDALKKAGNKYIKDLKAKHEELESNLDKQNKKNLELAAKKIKKLTDAREKAIAKADANFKATTQKLLDQRKESEKKLKEDFEADKKKLAATFQKKKDTLQKKNIKKSGELKENDEKIKSQMEKIKAMKDRSKKNQETFLKLKDSRDKIRERRRKEAEQHKKALAELESKHKKQIEARKAKGAENRKSNDKKWQAKLDEQTGKSKKEISDLDKQLKKSKEEQKAASETFKANQKALKGKHETEIEELKDSALGRGEYFSAGTVSEDTGFYLIPLYSPGFSKNPKGWNGKWAVPTMQVLDEYAEVMADSAQNISALNLLFLIAARAKALYDYELKESETMLIYSMLDPYDEDAAPDNVIEIEDAYDKELGSGETSGVTEALEGLLEGEATSRAGLYRNPPANILPYGISPSELAEPFNKQRAEYIFTRLTDSIKNKRRGKKKDTPPPPLSWNDATKKYNKLKLPEGNGKIERLIHGVADGTIEPPKGDKDVTKHFAQGTLKELFKKETLPIETYPTGKHDITALKAFMELVEAHKSDIGSKTSRQGLSSVGAFAAPDLEAAIKMLDSPTATGGLIMTKAGEYRVVMPAEQSKHMRSGWEPIQYEREAGYFMPPEQAKGLSRAKANPSFDSIGSEIDDLIENDQLTILTMLEAMDNHKIKNGTALMRTFKNMTSHADPETRKQMQNLWAMKNTKKITNDYGLRQIWLDIIFNKYGPSGKLDFSAIDGRFTDPNASTLPRQATRSMAEAAAQTRANKTGRPVFLWKDTAGMGEPAEWNLSVIDPGPAPGRVPNLRFEPLVDTNPPEVRHECSYRKTKRSKACGNRLTKMRNGRLYKCKKCGAKYEER